MRAPLMLWTEIRSSLWFIPTLTVTGAVILALGLIEADSIVSGERLTRTWPRVFGAGADGSRGLLSAIAGSMITVAGVTFSITVVALALASSQYTSRILRNFMRDEANQAVLGVFLGVFAYCLVVLRTIRGGDEGVFVPALAVFVAVLLAFVAIGFLIFFIHHVAASIQATSIIEAVAAETLRAVDRLFPAEAGEAVAARSESELAAQIPSDGWTAVPSRMTGYIQAVDMQALFDVAREEHIVVRMEKRIGDFLIEASPLVSVTGGRQRREATMRCLNAAFTVGPFRTVEQDAAYGIRQIVDIALKALSPAINDTTTAINCVDFLGAILARLASRRIAASGPSAGNRVGVIARGCTFQALLDQSFDQIRQNADRNVAVLIRALQILEMLSGRTTDVDRRLAIRAHADLFLETSERTVPSAHDRAVIRGASTCW